MDTWRNEKYEKGEAQSFYNDFFNIFGVQRRSVAVYEKLVRKLNNTHGFIDLFWPKTMIAEHKSAGSDLDAAMKQAEEYFVGLDEDIRPRFMLSCDFHNFMLIDLEENTKHEFSLDELPEHTHLFDFIRGIRRHDAQTKEDPVSIRASEIMAGIYDSLKESGYPAHDMEYFLTRLTFCLFADDTGIFDPRGIFHDYVKNRTKEDGTDFGSQLSQIFQVLNTPDNQRQNKIDGELAQFPYINGNLFAKNINIPAFDSKMRGQLLDASEFNWSGVSPAIFGSLFQSVMDDDERRKEGAHYTTEENIMKVIRPLFLDDMKTEFDNICKNRGKRRKAKLEEFQKKLAGLKFFDPACGSGNFLIITYRELRRLETDVILKLHGGGSYLIEPLGHSLVNVDQFFGIEKREFSARIAEVAMWMMDHLMNNELGQRSGMPYIRIPIEKSPTVKNADSLEMDWNDLLPADECSYILGNPPFSGSKTMTYEQRKQVQNVAGKSTGTLDYVSAWFIKAAYYSHNDTGVGFVATNSIVQGEQVGNLWPIIIHKYGMNISFAYRSFKWGSEARGKAQVTVVIIGLVRVQNVKKRLFHMDGSDLIEEGPKHITPYLIGAKKPLPIVKESSTPLNELGAMVMGSKPIDGGNYIFTNEEKKEFLKKEPGAKDLFRPYVNSRDFINGDFRWILALHDTEPNKIRQLPNVIKCVEAVKSFRLASKSKPTQKLALTPTKYHLNVLPKKSFLLVPSTTSEKRDYVPMGYVNPPIIPSNATMIVEDAGLGLFGIMTSKMHMVWLRTIGGRLKTDLRYSAGMVYNTFPVPGNDFSSIEKYARAVLDARNRHADSTLADMYDPSAMPTDLRTAHNALDRAVDRLYRRKPFESDNERVEFLLEKYKEMTNDGKTAVRNT